MLLQACPIPAQVAVLAACGTVCFTMPGPQRVRVARKDRLQVLFLDAAGTGSHVGDAHLHWPRGHPLPLLTLHLDALD